MALLQRLEAKRAGGGGGGRSAEDYGVPDLTDEQLQELASNPRKYGEKSGHARRELIARQGQQRDVQQFRTAGLQAYGPELSRTLQGVTNYLGSAGPLADSGAATALRARAVSDIYGRLAGGTQDFVGDVIKQRQNFRYQRQLQEAQSKAQKKKWYDYAAAGAGALASAF